MSICLYSKSVESIFVLYFIIILYCNGYSIISMNSQYPKSQTDRRRDDISKRANALGPILTASAFYTFNGLAEAAPLQSTISLNPDAYSSIGNMKSCKLLNGMWQVSGGHGYFPNQKDSVSAMAKCIASGYSSFDLADIYGPAEDLVGLFLDSNPIATQGQFFTKWVPRPGIDVTRAFVNDAIGRSSRRMSMGSLDLVQFHWWDYTDNQYSAAVGYLMDLKADGKIKNLGLCNFDTKHMMNVLDDNGSIVSNQVSFSILDNRPLKYMAPLCIQNNIKLLCYGTLLGGFLSEKWLNKQEPSYDLLQGMSLKKYFPWIKQWGGWSLFQELLSVLNNIAIKHNVSISNVALKWVLDQPSVGGAIVGIRLGLNDHLADNARVFGLQLDEADNGMISDIQSKGKNLINIYGDCGGEYRRNKS